MNEIPLTYFLFYRKILNFKVNVLLGRELKLQLANIMRKNFFSEKMKLSVYKKRDFLDENEVLVCNFIDFSEKN